MAAPEDPAGPDAAMDRPIPCRRAPDVSVATGQEGGGTRFYLKTPSGQVFSLGPPEYLLWTSLDGQASFADIAQAFADQFGLDLAPQVLVDFIAEAARNGLIACNFAPGEDLARDFGVAPAGRTRRPADRPARPPFGREPFTLILGDPTRIFAVLVAIFWPLRIVRWLWLPAAFVALLILIKHWAQYQTDWSALVGSIPFWPCMYLFEHTLAFLARAIEGSIIQANGGAVRYFGLRFFMGILVRGFIDERGASTLPKAQRLWSKGGALMFRVAVFDIGVFVWIATRQTHPVTSKIGLFCAVLAIFTLCLNACPLVPAEGYELLASFLKQPELNSRAFRLVGLHLSGRAAPPAIGPGERVGLMFFAAGTVIATAFIIGHILIEVDQAAVGAVQGLGLCFVIGVYVVSVLYFYLLIKFAKKMEAAQKAIVTAHRREEAQQT